MQQLKEYSNLKNMYRKAINKFRIPFFVSLLMFVLLFGTLMIEIISFDLTMTLLLVMIALAFIYGILWLVFSIRMRKYLKAFTMGQLEKINNEIPTCTMCEGLLVTSQAIIGTKGGMTLAPVANILWVYKSVTVTRLYHLIPIYKSTVLFAKGKDHKTYSFNIKNKGNAFEFIQSELSRYHQDVVYGYDARLEELYKKDINRMIALSQECGQKRRQEMQLQ